MKRKNLTIFQMKYFKDFITYFIINQHISWLELDSYFTLLLCIYFYNMMLKSKMILELNGEFKNIKKRMSSSKLKLNKNSNKNKKNEEKIEDSIKRSNYKKK